MQKKLKPYHKSTYLLTDDNAPVEVLGMQIIDGLIQEEVRYYKSIFKERGFKEFLQYILF